MKIYYLLILLFPLINFSCKKDNTNSEKNETINTTPNKKERFTAIDFFLDTEIDSLKNIVYGSAKNWRGDTTELLIDAYFPKNNLDTLTNKPTIVIMHGGGYLVGNKEEWADECIEFAKKGFVAFTIKYRLGWDNSISLGIINAAYRANQDIRAALRYIVDNASLYKINTDWIFIGGGSAGANCALNLIYNTPNEWEDASPGIENALGNLNTSGNNLTNNFMIKGLFNNWGGATAKYIQPNEMIPMISFHGELDSVIPIDGDTQEGLIGSRNITNLLKNNSVCSDLTVKKDGEHVVYIDLPGTVFRVGRASCFFGSIMKNNCSNFYAERKVDANCSP